MRQVIAVVNSAYSIASRANESAAVSAIAMHSTTALPADEDRERGADHEAEHRPGGAHRDPLNGFGLPRPQDEEDRQRDPVAVLTKVHDLVGRDAGRQREPPARCVADGRGATLAALAHRSPDAPQLLEALDVELDVRLERSRGQREEGLERRSGGGEQHRIDGDVT